MCIYIYIYISWTFLDYPDPNDEISTWLWDVMGFDNLMIHSNGTPETTETVRNHYSSVCLWSVGIPIMDYEYHDNTQYIG